MPQRSHAATVNKYNGCFSYRRVVPGSHARTCAAGWLVQRYSAVGFKKSFARRHLAKRQIPLVYGLSRVEPGGGIIRPVGQRLFGDGFICRCEGDLPVRAQIGDLSSRGVRRSRAGRFVAEDENGRFVSSQLEW